MLVRNISNSTNNDVGIAPLTDKKIFMLDCSVEIDLHRSFRENLINRIVPPAD